MLKQASVGDLKSEKISRDQGDYIVISMCFYPRFVRRELRDEYLSDLAPDRVLFGEFKRVQRATGDHNGAFARVSYEKRFALTNEGIEHLARLSTLAHERDVYLVCQCTVGERCHREMLLLMAKQWFTAKAEPPTNDYPVFRKRLSKRFSREVQAKKPGEPKR
jgi:hypothetical protein